MPVKPDDTSPISQPTPPIQPPKPGQPPPTQPTPAVTDAIDGVRNPMRGRDKREKITIREFSDKEAAEMAEDLGKRGTL